MSGLRALASAGLLKQLRELYPSPQSVALGLIRAERMAQDAKWGSQRLLSEGTWLKILVEEVGEVARASLEHDEQNLLDELTQVAAVTLAWMEAMICNAQAKSKRQFVMSSNYHVPLTSRELLDAHTGEGGVE